VRHADEVAVLVIVITKKGGALVGAGESHFEGRDVAIGATTHVNDASHAVVNLQQQAPVVVVELYGVVVSVRDGREQVLPVEPVALREEVGAHLARPHDETFCQTRQAHALPELALSAQGRFSDGEDRPVALRDPVTPTPLLDVPCQGVGPPEPQPDITPESCRCVKARDDQRQRPGKDEIAILGREDASGDDVDRISCGRRSRAVRGLTPARLPGSTRPFGALGVLASPLRVLLAGLTRRSMASTSPRLRACGAGSPIASSPGDEGAGVHPWYRYRVRPWCSTRHDLPKVSGHGSVSSAPWQPVQRLPCCVSSSSLRRTPPSAALLPPPHSVCRFPYSVSRAPGTLPWALLPALRSFRASAAQRRACLQRRPLAWIAAGSTMRSRCRQPPFSRGNIEGTVNVRRDSSTTRAPLEHRSAETGAEKTKPEPPGIGRALGTGAAGAMMVDRGGNTPERKSDSAGAGLPLMSAPVTHTRAILGDHTMRRTISNVATTLALTALVTTACSKKLREYGEVDGDGGNSGNPGKSEGGQGGDAGPGQGEPLSVVDVTPPSGESDVERDVPIVVTFSAAVDPESVTTSAFEVVGVNGPIAGTLTVEDEVITFRPERRWHLHSEVTVKVSTDLKGSRGERLAEGAESSFFVRDGEFGDVQLLSPQYLLNMEGIANDSGDTV